MKPAPRVNFVAVGSGGFLGAIARYELGRLASGDYAFWITGVINLSGCFGLAFILRCIVNGNGLKMSEKLRLFLTTGFLGAFTTFSTFSLEVLNLARTGQVGWASGYAVGSLAGGILAAWLGWLTANKFYPN